VSGDHRTLRRLHTALGGVIAGALTLSVSAAADAERLPLRRYTTTDGLPSNSLSCVVRDSRGFLWFCTAEGLSRFDGYTFVNYGVDQGLPDRLVTSFAESKSGAYWVATPRGLARFNPKPSRDTPAFVAMPLGADGSANNVSALLATRDGALWAATLGGVFRLSNTDERWTAQRVEFRHGSNVSTTPLGSEGPLMEDRFGNLWAVFGASTLYRRRPDGTVDQLDSAFFRHDNRIGSLFEDSKGRIWIGSYRGLALLVGQPRPGGQLIARIYDKRDGLFDHAASGVFQTADGRLWVGSGGLFEILPDASGTHATFKPYGRASDAFMAIDTEDVEGNLWMGSTRIARHGFTTYDRSDGLATDDIRSIIEGPDGVLYVITGIHSRHLHRFDGRRFTSVTPMFPGYDASRDWFWGWGQIHFPDQQGEWWVATIAGLLRYPRVARLEELGKVVPRRYTARDGLSNTYLFRLHQDSRGDVWIGSWDAPCLARWDRATRRFHMFSAPEGWPSRVPTAFAEDRSGSLWIGLWGHDLARFRAGRFRVFTAADGLPDSGVVSLFLDHHGQLWIGTSRDGLVRVADPTGEQPRFVAYTTRDGLSSNNVRAITEDRSGRIYFWTGRGVDRLEPATGRIKHYTTADGLVPAGSDNQEAFCDREGRLWFGFYGLSRLDPEPDGTDLPAPPPIRITELRVRGVRYPISELGESSLAGVVLEPAENQIAVDFASLNFGVGEILRYQYKLEGSDRDWSPPAELRSVNYADVRPGTYRFLVRAIDAEGLTSAVPASLSFQVMAPVWRREWFLSLAVAAGAGFVYALHRYRVAQLVAVERLRTRIASDLHDDIGAGLSQIAILSEVAKRSPDGAATADLLDHVANVSRELVDAMSEIVWAISPRRDSFEALVRRMRRFGSDVLAPRNVQFDLRVLQTERDPRLGPDVGRQMFLVFKEAINNAARHAASAHVSASLSIDRHRLLLTVADDGRGFETNVADDDRRGHGLASLRRRAAGMGGHLDVVSAPGMGTRVVLNVPLTRRHLFPHDPSDHYLSR
jgi:signal transduction histidine kinase/ligand-binding sensor domain-containing protein